MYGINHVEPNSHLRYGINHIATLYLRYGINHVQTHLHTALGVVWAGLGEAAHAVVTVPQDLDPQAVVVSGQAVKSGKQLIQELNQLLGGALR